MGGINESHRIVISLAQNIGGSGGFYYGLAKAITLDIEWVWVSDDDAFPEADSLKMADKFLTNNIERLDDISAICGEVLNNAAIDVCHRRIWSREFLTTKQRTLPLSDYEKEYFELNCFSYVGTIINVKKFSKLA